MSVTFHPHLEILPLPQRRLGDALAARAAIGEPPVMKPLPRTAELERVARRLVWFEAPAKALADPVRLLAYAMIYGTHEDMHTLRRYFGDEDLREALDRAPAGIFDPRSWSYWHLVLDRWPPPPLPERKLP